ncbi:MAG TPA: STAS domain-containing protein [Nocardioides sp.]|jgi:anti-anti-sigma factor|nr:STAS domain-containing protein [Nocardioides sp.]
MSLHTERGGDHDAPGNAWYQVDQMRGCAVVRAGGEIDASTVHALDAAITEAGSLASRVVIDLTRVTFVDSSGLGALIVARKSARERGGSMSLVCPPPAVRRLLGSTHLDDVFAIHDSLDEAVNAR